MAAHRAPALQASAMVADEESSGHTSSESDGYILEVLQEVEAEEVKRIQRNHAQTTLSDDLSTVAQAGSDASGSDESELEQPLDVLARMASVPEEDENDAVSSHPSSAEEDTSVPEEPTFTRASGDSDGTPPTRDTPAMGTMATYEMEHYSVEQMIAATAGQPTIKTLVLIGDVHQRLKVRNPKYPRTSWVSSVDGTMQELEERRAHIELDEEGDGEDDRARGPSPGASSAANAREIWQEQ